MSTNKTTNLLMHSWVGTDMVDFNEVNQNFSILDEAVGTMKKVKVNVENYKRQGAETDDTARIQRAIDAAPEFSTLVFDPAVTYYVKNVSITKSLDLDFNNSKIVADPTTAVDSGTGNMVKGNPAFYFKGAIGTAYNLQSSTGDDTSVSLTTAAEASNFTVGDYVFIEDQVALQKWDGSGTASTSRGEINKITAISGGTLTLMRGTEWNYTVTPTIKKLTLLKHPKVYGIKNMTETDPGFPYSGGGLTGFAPHMIHFQYCLMPEVKNCHFDGWQLHAVNFHYCLFPKLSKSTGKNAFRPDTAGTGYFMRFERCIGGTTEQCEITNVRHAVDFVMSYDCLSFNNIAHDMKYPPYAWHGNQSKRCNSLNDTAIGGTADIGWCVGNPSFEGDYDVTITNPTYRGSNKGIVVQCKSSRVQIVNPYIKTISTGIAVTSGADDVFVQGGRIAVTGTADAQKFALIVRPKNALADASGVKVGKVRMDSTMIRGVGQILLVDDFSFEYINVDIEMDNTVHESAVHTSTTIDPIKFILRNGSITGNYQKAVTVYKKPSSRYEVSNIYASGYTVQGVNIIGFDKLRFVDNDFVSANPYNIYSTDAPTGVYRGNRPATTWG